MKPQREHGLCPATPRSWNAVERDGETIYVHATEPLWIVCYEGIEMADYIRPTFWQVYRAIVRAKNGAAPWAADNKKLSERGYSTLEAAMAAGEDWIANNKEVA